MRLQKFLVLFFSILFSVVISQVQVMSVEVLDLNKITPPTIEVAIQLWKKGKNDKFYNTDLPEPLKEQLKNQLEPFFPGIIIQNAQTWYDGKGVYPLIIRTELPTGKKIPVTFLYSVSNSNSKFLGIFMFIPGNPGTAHLILNEEYAVNISIAQTFLSDKTESKDLSWNQRAVVNTDEWQVECTVEKCDKSYIWFTTSEAVK